MTTLLSFLLGFVGFVLWAAGMAKGVKLLRWVIGPLFSSTPRERVRPQFTISDVLCLMLLLQPALVWGARQPRPFFQDAVTTIFLALALSTSVVSLWLLGVIVLTQLGVRQTTRRCAMLLVWIPGASLTTLAAMHACFELPIAILEYWGSRQHDWQFLGWWLADGTGAVVAVIISAVLLRLLARWIAAGSVVGAATADEEPSDGGQNGDFEREGTAP
ncbi:MAG: hypothetical protein ACOY3P_19190 [Planctomycetota bacterium]